MAAATFIASDGSWTAGFGPILAADLYAGETYDARLELAGWDRPGFANPAWLPVQVGTSLNPIVQAAPGAPVQRTGEIRPAAITQPKPGLHVVDFGRNFAGWMRLRIHAPAGTKITMRFGEMLNADGTVYRTNLRGARATDCYLCRGTGEEVWEPRFTYHGFQYVEVEGLPLPPDPKMFTGILVGSALPLDGFVCLLERDHDPDGGQYAVYDPREPRRCSHRLPAARRAHGLDGLSRGRRPARSTSRTPPAC